MRQFLGSLPLVAAEFGNQCDHGGVDAGHQLIGVLAPITPSNRGRPSAATALAGNTRAGSPWRAGG
jgi:hypothetical protein